MIPGEYLLGDGDVVANAGRDTVELEVTNTADRPIHSATYTKPKCLRPPLRP